jgi:ureidoacrylate peracid hydrolase
MANPGAALRTSLPEIVSPSTTALLVVDVQNDFCRDELRQAMIPSIERVLAGARAAGALVVYVQNTVLPGGMSDAPADLARRRKVGVRADVTIEGTEGHRFVDRIAPRDGDPVVRKHRLNAFVNTTLDTILRSAGIETIVIAGTATHGCVINTAYGGVALNYYVVVVRDAAASWRTELHDAAIFLMENTINEVVTADELLDAWAAHPDGGAADESQPGPTVAAGAP